ncbi:MAG TPA: PaaI family thioesterase [Solirubrobacteraceae bacterium]|nr:PaaI family thioesterase [Solirubrobacteraceae bacterium]
MSDHPSLTTESLHRLMPFAQTLGIELIVAAPAEVRCRLPWQQRLEGAGVGLHGGASMGLADAAGGICAALNLPDGATGTTTIESKTNFLRAIRSGTIEAISRPLHTGRSVIVIETDLMDHESRLAARVTQSQIVLRAAAA